MRTALAILFAAVLYSAAGTTAVDFYLDMEGGTNRQVITTNLLSLCTHVAPGAGYWSFGRGHPEFCTDCFEQLTNVTDFEVMTNVGTNPVWQLRSPVKVAGVTYNDATHTRVFGKGLNMRDQGAQFNFTPPRMRVSIGFYYTMALGYTGQDIGDDILATGFFNYASESDWEYDILAGPVVNFRASVFVHSHAGGPGNTTSITLNYLKTYWVTQLWDGSNGVAKVQLYDPITWTQVGSTSTLVLSNLPCEFFQFGELQNTNSSFAVTNCFGNMIMDWTTATFPLLLPAPPPPPATNMVISWTPPNSVTLQRSTNRNNFIWQTFSNNATPPITIPLKQSLPEELFRVKSSGTTTMFIKTQ